MEWYNMVAANAIDQQTFEDGVSKVRQLMKKWDDETPTGFKNWMHSQKYTDGIMVNLLDIFRGHVWEQKATTGRDN
jgi:hypothetical protein